MAITDPLPTVGGDDGVWGTKLNTVIEDLITALDGLSQDGQTIVGPQGPKGDTGATGPAGPTGLKGDTGAPGSGVAIRGLVANTGLLPVTGNSGDAWLVGTTSSSNLYVWDVIGSQWSNVGTIQGPAGATGAAGAAGATGATGAAGNTVLNGTATPPSNGTGANGDFYYNTTTKTLWGPKAAGAWPGSGVGLTGPTGPVGALFHTWSGSAFAVPGTTPNVFVSPSTVDPATHGQTVNDGDLWFKTS